MEKIKTPFRDMTIGQKLEHIWEYYKPAIFGIAAAIALIVYIIYKIVSPDPEGVLNVTLVNANGYEVAEEDSFIRYLKEQGYDTDAQTALVNTSLSIDASGGQMSATSMQVLSAMMMVGEIDLLAGNEDTLQILGSSGSLIPVDQILREDQLKAYEDRLYSVKNTETGEEQVCGIWLGENSLLVQDGYYYDKVLVCIPSTTAHQELAAGMIRFLLDQE